MSSSLISSVAPIALQPGEGDARWFLGFLVTIKSTAEATNGRVAVIEHLGTQGLGSPLHVHRNEDEWFYVTEGELTFWVGGETINAPAGSFVYGPRDVPHTFTVTSDAGPLPPRHRARRLRRLHAHALRARSDPHPSASVPAATRSRTDDGHRRRVRNRDPRPSRHPHVSRTSPSTRWAQRRSRRRGRNGARRARTADLYDANVALSQLSYGPVWRLMIAPATVAVSPLGTGDHARPGTTMCPCARLSSEQTDDPPLPTSRSPTARRARHRARLRTVRVGRGEDRRLARGIGARARGRRAHRRRPPRRADPPRRAAGSAAAAARGTSRPASGFPSRRSCPAGLRSGFARPGGSSFPPGSTTRAGRTWSRSRACCAGRRRCRADAC